MRGLAWWIVVIGCLLLLAYAFGLVGAEVSR
jgi:hypothetical protein